MNSVLQSFSLFPFKIAFNSLLPFFTSSVQAFKCSTQNRWIVFSLRKDHILGEKFQGTICNALTIYMCVFLFAFWLWGFVFVFTSSIAYCSICIMMSSERLLIRASTSPFSSVCADQEKAPFLWDKASQEDAVLGEQSDQISAPAYPQPGTLTQQMIWCNCVTQIQDSELCIQLNLF